MDIWIYVVAIQRILDFIEHLLGLPDFSNLWHFLDALNALLFEVNSKLAVKDAFTFALGRFRN